jgi:hypothetical protein
LGFKTPDAFASFAFLKPYEDALDAIICSWVGACFFEGKADPLGTMTLRYGCRLQHEISYADGHRGNLGKSDAGGMNGRSVYLGIIAKQA